MKSLLKNSVSLFVVVIVLLLIIPLNPFVLDIFFILNIALSLTILLITMNIKEALEFSIFPSLISKKIILLTEQYIRSDEEVATCLGAI